MNSDTTDLFVLQDRQNPVWSLGGAVFAPLYRGGALKAQVEARTAEQKQAVAQYVTTALKAFGDVENALSSEFALEERETRFELGPRQSLPGVSSHGLAEAFPTDRARSFYGGSKLAAEILVEE